MDKTVADAIRGDLKIQAGVLCPPLHILPDADPKALLVGNGIVEPVSPSNTLDQPGLVPGTLPWLESNEALALATRMAT